MIPLPHPTPRRTALAECPLRRRELALPGVGGRGRLWDSFHRFFFFIGRSPPPPGRERERWEERERAACACARERVFFFPSAPACFHPKKKNTKKNSTPPPFCLFSFSLLSTTDTRPGPRGAKCPRRRRRRRGRVCVCGVSGGPRREAHASSLLPSLPPPVLPFFAIVCVRGKEESPSFFTRKKGKTA